MKKLLALVLALVMTLSLCVTSNAAYAGEEFDYEEAVEVMTAVGVFQGDENGKFNPTGILTREQAAKIVTYMLLGKKAADALVTIAAPFADVEATRWSAGSIAYCYNEGILAGVGNGMFAPTSELTGLAFAKMMLTALGYSAENEGLTGSNWSINTAKLALTIGLTKGMDDVSLSAPMTREQAAKMALNTEKATLVNYPNASVVKVGDVEVTTSAKASDVANTAAASKHYDGKADGKMQFCEKYATKLSVSTKAADQYDSFGRPSVTWVYDKEDVGTYADDADQTIVVSKTGKTLSDMLIGDDFLDYAAKDVASNGVVFLNGEAVGSIGSEKTMGVLRGDIIEVFEDDDGVVEIVVIRRYAAYAIDDVEDELTAAVTKKGASYAVVFEAVDASTDYPTSTYYDAYENDSDKVLPGFDAATYVKDAIVVVAQKYSGGVATDVILDSYIPEVVTGIVTKHAVGEKTVLVGGTKYAQSGIFDGVGSGYLEDEEYNLYLSKEGYTVAIVGAKDIDLKDVWFVTGTYGRVSTYGSNAFFAQAVNVVTGEDKEFALENKNGGGGDSRVLTGLSSISWDDANAGLYTFSDKSVGTGAARSTGGNEKYDAYAYTANATYSYTIGTSASKASNAGKEVLSADVKADAATLTIKANSAGNVTTKNYDLDHTSGANAGSAVKKYFGADTTVVAIEGTQADLKAYSATGGMKMAQDDADMVIVFYKAGKSTAVSVVYVGETLNTAVGADTVVYVAAGQDFYVNTKKNTTDMAIWFMKDYTAKDVVAKGSTWADANDGFYEYDIDKDDVYDLAPVTEVANGTTVSETTDGAVTDVVVAEDAFNATHHVLTGTADRGSSHYVYLVDVCYEDAKVIDTRTASARKDDLYTQEITTVAALEKAMDKGDVTIDVYLVDGEIEFLAVTACENAAGDGDSIADPVVVSDIEAIELGSGATKYKATTYYIASGRTLTQDEMFAALVREMKVDGCTAISLSDTTLNYTDALGVAQTRTGVTLTQVYKVTAASATTITGAGSVTATVASAYIAGGTTGVTVTVNGTNAAAASVNILVKDGSNLLATVASGTTAGAFTKTGTFTMPTHDVTLTVALGA